MKSSLLLQFRTATTMGSAMPAKQLRCLQPWTTGTLSIVLVLVAAAAAPCQTPSGCEVCGQWVDPCQPAPPVCPGAKPPPVVQKKKKCASEFGLYHTYDLTCTHYVGDDDPAHQESLLDVLEQTNAQHEADRKRCGYTLPPFHCPKPLTCEQKNKLIAAFAEKDVIYLPCPFREPPPCPAPINEPCAADERWMVECFNWRKQKADDIRKHPEKYNKDPRCHASSTPSS